MVAGNLARKISAPVETEVHIAESSVKWCSVSLSDVLSRQNRLEASVFDVEAKQAWETITTGKYPAVNLIAPDGFVERAHYGGRLKRNYADKSRECSIGFIGSSEMLDVNPQPIKHMIDSDRVKDLHVREGMVLISRSGTIGNMSFVNRTLSRLLECVHTIYNSTEK